MAAKPTQSRERGQGAIAPCGVQRRRLWWGLGQRPNCSTGDQLCQTRSTKGAGSEASLPVTLRVRRRASKLLFQPIQHCRARWARLTSIGNDSFLGAGLFRCRDFASAEATRGLCGRPLDCFAAHTPIIDFVCCMENRVYGHNSGAQNPPHAKSRRVLPAAAIVIHKDSTFLALIPHPCPRTLPAPSLPPPSRRRGGRSTS